MTHPVIRVQGLAKRYRLGARVNPLATFREALANAVKSPFKRFRQLSGRDDANDAFWALDDVSFEVQSGEAVGIVGRNGAGKSTLLKILSRITHPTRGRVELEGRVGSLLEVGTGFHPELSGRENIFLNGAILGMHRAEIKRKFDEIVAFAEIDRFLDTQVKHYSSGMYVRLAFAVAAHFEPEILLVDEVLAVGDAIFQKKCLGKMNEVAQGGRTVLFVSHQMGAISRLCTQVVWLDHGRLVGHGAAKEIIARYLKADSNARGDCSWPDGLANPGVDEFQLMAMRILNEAGEVTAMLDVRKSFWIEMRYRVVRKLSALRVGFLLHTLDGQTLLEAYDADASEFAAQRQPGEYVVRCQIPGQLLSPGSYSLSMNAGIYGIKNLLYREGLLELTIEDVQEMGGVALTPRSGLIRPKLNWVAA